mgnify:CR=1 FL=1
MGNGLVSRTQAFSFLDFGMTTLLDFGMVCARLGPRTRFAALRVLSIHPAFMDIGKMRRRVRIHTYVVSFVATQYASAYTCWSGPAGPLQMQQPWWAPVPVQQSQVQAESRLKLFYGVF